MSYTNIREFKKLRRQRQRKRYVKIELCCRLSIGHVAQVTESAVSLAWYEWFYARAKNKRFTAAGSRCHQELKNENFTSSLCSYVKKKKKKVVLKSVLHVYHNYSSSINQSNH